MSETKAVPKFCGECGRELGLFTTISHARKEVDTYGECPKRYSWFGTNDKHAFVFIKTEPLIQKFNEQTGEPSV